MIIVTVQSAVLVSCVLAIVLYNRVVVALWMQTEWTGNKGTCMPDYILKRKPKAKEDDAVCYKYAKLT